MEDKKQRVYSLAMEELALALGLVNEPGSANQLLTGGIIKIKPEEIDVRMDSAIHSMLARELCKINSQGKAILDAGLQEAIGLLTKFEKIISLTLVVRKKKVESTIRVDQRGCFLVQTVSPDGVHILEYYARPDEIHSYLAGILGVSGSLKKSISVRDLPITARTLSEIMEQEGIAQNTDILQTAGWDELSANTLAGDLQKEIIRGMLLLAQIGSSTAQQEYDQAEKRNLFFLNSKEHLWLFDFPSVTMEKEGTANLVSHQEAVASLTAFLQQEG